MFWLAEAGLLDGKGGDHLQLALLQRISASAFPGSNCNQDKHLTDADNLDRAGWHYLGVRPVYDLIERFCGANIAQAVARDILYEVQRSYSPGRIGFGGQAAPGRDNPADPALARRAFCRKIPLRRRRPGARHEHPQLHAALPTATGDKPLHYLQRLRIETAKGLLSGSRKSIKTISY